MKSSLTYLGYYGEKNCIDKNIRKKILYEIIDFWLNIQKNENYITIFQTSDWVKNEILEVYNSKDRENLEEEIGDYINMLVRKFITLGKSREEIFLILEEFYKSNKTFKRLFDNVSLDSWQKNKQKFKSRYFKVFEIKSGSNFDINYVSVANFKLQKSKELGKTRTFQDLDNKYLKVLENISLELGKNKDDFLKFSIILNEDIKNQGLLFLRSYSILGGRSKEIFQNLLNISEEYDFLNYYLEKDDLITKGFPDFYFSLFKKFSKYFKNKRELIYLIDKALTYFLNMKEVYNFLCINNFKKFCENLQERNIYGNINLFISFLPQRYLKEIKQKRK